MLFWKGIKMMISGLAALVCVRRRTSVRRWYARGFGTAGARAGSSAAPRRMNFKKTVATQKTNKTKHSHVDQSDLNKTRVSLDSRLKKRNVNGPSDSE